MIEFSWPRNGGIMESNASTPKLADVIRQFREIHVDDYQRTYSWEKEQIDELFEDLKDTASSGEPHFFGTLIFESRDGSRATIVDGQQRLTTIFVLVAALRDEISQLSITTIDPDSHGKLPIFVVGKAWSILYPGQDTSEHRFLSNRFLQDIFEKGVMPEPAQQQEIKDRKAAISLRFRKGIKRVRSLVREDLAAYPSELDKLKRINSLLDALLEKFVVLRVLTSNLSESLDIFLTLNNRGLPLGPSDLVRGLIMSNLGQGESEKDQSKIYKRVFTEWTSIADMVIEPEIFLRHYLVATGKSKVQKKRVVEAVTNRIKDEDPIARKKKSQTFWNDVLEGAELYQKIIDPKMGGDTQLYIELLEGLIKSHRVLLLSAFKHMDEQSPDFQELVRLTMVLGYRWVIAGGNAQQLEDFFQLRSTDLREGLPVRSVLEELKRKASVEIDISEFLAEEGESSFVTKALLYSLNRKLTPDSIEIKLNKSLHLEHIAPRSDADDAWKAALFGGENARFEEYDQLVSEVGNLTLLDSKINIKLQTKPFNIKSAKYDLSVLKITRDLVNLNDWSEKEIKARTKWLAEAFEVIWSIEPSPKKLLPFSEWYSNQ